MRALFIAIAFTAAAGVAHAATTDCAGAGDGTPCTGPCVAAGRCAAGACAAIDLFPDGTACASGDRCSLGDTCFGGLCKPGGTEAVCPDAPCALGVCDPDVGCRLVPTCAPDAAAPPNDLAIISYTNDLGAPPAPAPDLGQVAHVHGSSVSGCSLGAPPGRSRSPLVVAVLLLAAAALGRRD